MVEEQSVANAEDWFDVEGRSAAQQKWLSLYALCFEPEPCRTPSSRRKGYVKMKSKAVMMRPIHRG